jgi:transcription initiation factor TFIIF subunit alpha
MRAARTAAAGIAPRPKVKVERFDDDERREGRKLTRVSCSLIANAMSDGIQGMEGGVDEELDYDFNEEFQDDEENNTFYRDADEEEEAKLQEVRMFWTR